jgi:hypothetical protein
MDPEIIQYRLDCPLDRQEVSPLVCKKCERKTACAEVVKLGASGDMEKWKGTILGGGVNVIVEFRKNVMDFILDLK